ncbi:hypothetical protein BHF72_1469 [Cloacibacterium normanense]|uniref:Uncharacterized protein n=1 Tax=Cloacibacterium normanense TaxID=237258 RepID=A0A1E5UGJ5_9FLAO|nr:hypothetical protein BHF72_1469 [Cloacibacterium normanense]
MIEIKNAFRVLNPKSVRQNKASAPNLGALVVQKNMKTLIYYFL